MRSIYLHSKLTEALTHNVIYFLIHLQWLVIEIFLLGEYGDAAQLNAEQKEKENEPGCKGGGGVSHDLRLHRPLL